MILSKPELTDFASSGHISRPDGIEPMIDHVSIGLHLGEHFLRYKQDNLAQAFPLPSNLETETVEADEDGFVDFPAGCCLLASTLESVAMPLGLMGFIQTKGTIARGFVTVHLCDGQIDPGYQGNITLELVNLSQFTYRLKPGTPIAQLFLHKLTTALPTGYKGRYQRSCGPTSMRVK